MKFTAINVDGKSVEGVGVCKCNENFDNWNGKCVEDLIEALDKNDLSYLFTDTIEWVDGFEFNVKKFELVFTKSIKFNM